MHPIKVGKKGHPSGHLWLALRGGSESPLWLEVKEQEDGEEVVGANESTRLDEPWDGPAEVGVRISVNRTGPDSRVVRFVQVFRKRTVSTPI